MIGMKRVRHCSAVTKTAALGLVLIPILLGLNACANKDRFGGGQPELASTPPPAPSPPPPPAPPPVDLAGKWKLSVAGGGACAMTFGGSTGASDGSIAPAGGCPGSFFTSRKWSYEHDMLIVRNHKGEVLVELAFANGHFEGQAVSGGTVSLTR
jgi:Protease inhibitor Inh